MVNPGGASPLPAGDWWAMECGTFGQWDETRFFRSLARRLAQSPDRCLFVVVPDVPFDAEGTLARWPEYRDRCAAYGAPLAFVTQDGMGTEDIPLDADSLMVGGSTEWKLGHESTAMMAAAKARGMWVHVGRVNSYRRLKAAASAGADSADGTYLKYGPDVNWPRLRRWLDTHAANPTMVMT